MKFHVRIGKLPLNQKRTYLCRVQFNDTRRLQEGAALRETKFRKSRGTY